MGVRLETRRGGVCNPPRPSLRRPTSPRRQNRLPPSKVLLRNLLVARTSTPRRCIGGLQLGLLAVVPHKEARVGFDAVDHRTGHTQLDHDPIVGLWVVAARLPAVVPGACVHEHAWSVDGRGLG